MKMVKSLLLGALVSACAATSAFAALPPNGHPAPAHIAPVHAAPAILYAQAPVQYHTATGSTVLDANGNVYNIASPAQIAQRAKFAACAHSWAGYKVLNNVSGRAAYNAYMSGCLLAPLPVPVPVPPERPRRFRY